MYIKCVCTAYNTSLRPLADSAGSAAAKTKASRHGTSPTCRWQEEYQESSIEYFTQTQTRRYSTMSQTLRLGKALGLPDAREIAPCAMSKVSAQGTPRAQALAAACSVTAVLAFRTYRLASLASPGPRPSLGIAGVENNTHHSGALVLARHFTKFGTTSKLRHLSRTPCNCRGPLERQHLAVLGSHTADQTRTTLGHNCHLNLNFKCTPGSQ